jgi:hypothetical protein
MNMNDVKTLNNSSGTAKRHPESSRENHCFRGLEEKTIASHSNDVLVHLFFYIELPSRNFPVLSMMW